MQFEADAVLLRKDIPNDRWDKNKVHLSSVQAIHDAVGGIAQQINLDMWHKVYYNAAAFEGGVHAQVKDMDGNTQFLPSSFLLVLCDDKEPIDLGDSEYGDFFDWVSLF